MINIYIKSFNRPFYLDRCIRSVKFNVRNYGKIIILDDGTEQKFINRLMKTHPDVEFRSSGADDGKMALLREEKFAAIEQSYPSAIKFWTDEVAKDGSDYVFILEDDAWVCRQIDLQALEENLCYNKANICKFWWSGEQHKLLSKYSNASSPEVQYFMPLIESAIDIYQIWIVAFAVFKKEYWVHNVSHALRLADESSQLIAATKFLEQNPCNQFAVTDRRCVYQGWLIPGRSTPEYYDLGLKQHIYMDAINAAWMTGKLNVLQGYPYDFSDDYISEVLGNHINPEQLDVWQKWRSSIIYFYS